MVERRDKSWLVVVRTRRGARAVVTTDHGDHYSSVFTPFAGGADSRFALRRLKSGKLCLITHAVPEPCAGENWKSPRCNLAVWLSEDDGASWRGRLMLDEHVGVSYPDFTEDDHGNIYIAYDRTRIKGHGQVWLAKVTEADIIAGAFVTPGSFPGILVDAFPFKP
ncbi:MAG: exo-alpha-sialidase [Lentisphaeria bacterium]|nr:exo-alpha-sialidase [Lentisphaeria bacterium]